MNIFEFACFVGLPSIVAFVLLFGLPHSIRLSLVVGAGSAFVSLFAVVLFSYLYRLARRRRIEKAHVPIWACLAIVLSASVALYFRIQH
jgi:chromate transport protein ChrA